MEKIKLRIRAFLFIKVQQGGSSNIMNFRFWIFYLVALTAVSRSAVKVGKTKLIIEKKKKYC